MDLKDILYHPHVIGNQLGYPDLSEVHDLWFEHLFLKDEDTSLWAHRGAYKSTIANPVGVPLYLLANPNARVLIVRKTTSLAKSVLSEIKKNITSPAMQVFWESFYGKRAKLVIDNKSEASLNLKTRPSKEPNIMAVGIETQVTSLHFDYILNDDIVTVRDRVYKSERTKTDLVVSEQRNLLNPGGKIGNVGTPWHDLDSHRLMAEPWKWPVGTTHIKSFTPEEIDKRRRSMPPSLYSLNYLLEHAKDENTLFDDPKEGRHPADLDYILHIDAAYGGKDTNAFTAMAMDSRKIYYGHGESYEGHVADHWDKVGQMIERYKIRICYVEKNADKGWVKSELEKRFSGITVFGYHEKENKNMKITNYLYTPWTLKAVIWDKKTHPEYLIQIMDYVKGAEPDDAPDSASSAIRALKGAPVVTHEAESVPAEEYINEPSGEVY